MPLTLQAQVKWFTNQDEFRKALESGSTMVVAHEQKVEKLVRTMSGTGLLGSVNNVTAAIEKMGGVEKVTADRKEKINELLTKGIEQYRVLGREAPAAVLALAEATKKVETPTEAWNRQLDAVGGKLKTFGTAAKSAGTMLTAGVSLPLAGLATLALKASIDFESSFAGVRKTVDATEPELALLAQGFRDMAKTMPLSVNEINKVGEAAGQLGIKKENILSFTETMVKLGATTNLSADEAATAMARFTNVMKTPVQAVGNLGAALVALGNDGASTEQEIMEMANRISKSAATVGMSAPQVLGLANALSSINIEADMGGTAMQKMLLSIHKAVSSGGGALQQFAGISGMSAADFARKWRDDAGGAFAAFVAGLGKIERNNLPGVLEKIGISEARLTQTMLGVANASDLVSNSMALGTKAFADNAALNKEYEQRQKTLASQLIVVKNKLMDVAISLGDRLAPVLVRVIDAAKPMIDVFASVVQWFGGLPQPVQTAAIVLGGLVAAIGPLLVAFGSIASGVAAILPLFASGGAAAGVLGGALTLITGPIGLTVAGLGALLVASKAATGSWFGFLEPLKPVWDLSLAISNLISTVLLKALNALWAFLKPLASFVGDVLVKVWQLWMWELEKVGGVLTWVADKIKSLTSWLKSDTDAAKIEANAQHETATAMLQTGQAAAAAVPPVANLGKQFDVSSLTSGKLTGEQKALKKAHDEVAASTRTLTDTQRGMVAQLDAQGVSVSAIAKHLGIAEVQVRNLIESHKNSAAVAEKWADVQQYMAEKTRDILTKTIKQIEAAWLKEAEARAASLVKQLELERTVAEQVRRIGMSATEQRLRDIDQELKAKLRALATEANQDNAYIAAIRTGYEQVAQHQRDLVTGTASTIVERMRNAGVQTRADLEKTAADAQRDYDQMVAAGGAFSEKTIKHFKRVADEADAASRGTKTSWQKTYDAFGDVGTILDAIPGKFGEIGSMAARAGQAIMTNLADGNVWGAVIAGATAAVGILGKLFGFGKGEGRKVVEDFAAGFREFDLNTLQFKPGGGFDELHKKLSALGDKGERLWVALTQGVGKNNPEQAKAVIDLINKALAEQAQKQDDVAAATTNAATANNEMVNSALANINGLTSEYNKLWDSIKDEAPEEVMGLVETQTRARMAAIAQEREGAVEQLKGLTDSLGMGFDDVLKKLDEFINRLGSIPPIRIPIETTTTTGGEAPEFHRGTSYVRKFHDGGRVLPFMRPIIAHNGLLPDEVPAILQTGESVLNRRATAALGTDRISALNGGGDVRTDGGDIYLTTVVTLPDGTVLHREEARKISRDEAKKMAASGQLRPARAAGRSF